MTTDEQLAMIRTELSKLGQKLDALSAQVAKNDENARAYARDLIATQIVPMRQKLDKMK